MRIRPSLYWLISALLLAVLFGCGDTSTPERDRSAPSLTNDGVLLTGDEVRLGDGAPKTTEVPKYGIFEVTLTATATTPIPSSNAGR